MVEAVSVLELPRAVLFAGHKGQAVLDAQDRQRFPARGAPPGAVVPRLIAKLAPRWDGRCLAPLVRGGSREERETGYRGEGDAENVLLSDLLGDKSCSGGTDEDFDPRGQH